MMKIRIDFWGILVFTLSLVTAGCDVGPRSAERTDLLLTPDGKPTTALLTALQAFDIQHDGSLPSIVEQTQKNWLRPAGVEIFQMTDVYAQRLEELRPLFKKLGLVDAVCPCKKQYDYVLVHGGFLSRMRARIAHTVSLWLSGIRFKQLIFLTGQRTLDAKKEPLAALEDRDQTILPIRSDWKCNPEAAYKTEADMTKLIYEQAQLPADLRTVPVVFIDAPQTVAADGTVKRPSRYDTVVSWLRTNPAPGTCLFISSQPFVGCQDSVIRTVLPAAFDIETVGLTIPASDESVSLYLDSLARWLYQEQIRREK